MASDADTIAVFPGSARKQLSAMFSLAPGSQSGCVGSAFGSRMVSGLVRNTMPRRSIMADQNSARCSVDQRWRSAYEPTRRSRIIEPKFDLRIVSGDGIHAGPGPSLTL